MAQQRVSGSSRCIRTQMKGPQSQPIFHLLHVGVVSEAARQSLCRTAVLHCCKGDAASQWEMAILGVSKVNSVTPEPID